MREVVGGRLVLDDAVVPGRVVLDDGVITSVVPDAAYAIGPFVVPGFIDVHVHGWGGHDATGDADALSGMARALLRQGVTSFLPTAPSLAPDDLAQFADRVRAWMPSTAPSRWGSTSRARSSPPRAAAPTTPRCCGPRRISTRTSSSACSRACGS